ncbi:MAG: hypothetical protein JWO79_2644 [Actinomycetia bacterium]|nr:hypothetical protein [Actinomycetes bacterium]
MGCLAELDAAYHTLLLDSDARARLADDPETLGWSPYVTRLMCDVDVEDFRKLGRAIVRGVASGELCGMDLRRAFQTTIEQLAPLSADEVVERFVASPEFRRIRAVGNVPGFSPAQAFYEWACALDTAARLRTAVQHEYVRATLLALASTNAAYFAPRDALFRAVDRGWIAVLDGKRHLPDAETVPEAPVAAGAVRGRFWSVSVSLRSAAALLRATATPPRWAITEISDSEAAQLSSAMRARGMV